MSDRLIFSEVDAYRTPHPSGYFLLPHNFMRLANGRVLLTNDWGDWTLVEPSVHAALVKKTLDTQSSDYLDLKSKFFLSDTESLVRDRVLASRYRTKKAFIDGFTKLHIFVVSLRCDHSCPYCQVSRVSEDKDKFDMTEAIADRSIDLMMRSPAPAITCEFQGGEALLNFPLVKYIVARSKELNVRALKRIDYVVCTNLSTLSDEHLAYFQANNVTISTSLDGPAALHDRNRPFTKGSSHAAVVRNIARAQEALGKSAISALMTTTKESLACPREIVDEYLRVGLGSIFARSLSPYGFAVKTAKSIGYTMDDFLRFYRTMLAYVLEKNRAGIMFPEAFASTILRKMLTPFGTGFVDLQSPAGAGIGVVVYNYDGAVYATDESRMLAEMDDPSFMIGNVLEDDYEEIFLGERMQTIAAASCNEALAGCSDCAFQPYCGADPVYHYATQGDMFGNRASSGFCRKHMGVISHLFELLDSGDRDLQRIFWAWIGDTDLDEKRLPRAPWQFG